MFRPQCERPSSNIWYTKGNFSRRWFRLWNDYALRTGERRGQQKYIFANHPSFEMLVSYFAYSWSWEMLFKIPVYNKLTDHSDSISHYRYLFVYSQYDGTVADFPDRPHASSAGSSGSVSGSGTGNGQRWGGFSSYSDWKWHVLNKPNMDMLRNHKGTYKPVSSGKCWRYIQAKPTRSNVIQWYLLLYMLYMYQAVPPLISRSSKLYTQHRVIVELFLLLTAIVSELEHVEHL